MEGGSEIQAYQMRITSSEIVEMDEDSKSSSVVINRDVDDVYVAVGKDDVEVVKWAIDQYVVNSPGTAINLVHVFPPITSISTPVGRLSGNQLSKEQVRFHKKEESDKRKNLLQKYIQLCDDAKVPVETMLVESNDTRKAILDLIPVLNITKLVIGTKQLSSSRRSMIARMKKGEFVKQNAPDYCEVTIVRVGKRFVDDRKVVPATRPRPEISQQLEKKHFLGCACFSSNCD